MAAAVVVGGGHAVRRRLHSKTVTNMSVCRSVSVGWSGVHPDARGLVWCDILRFSNDKLSFEVCVSWS